MTLVNAHIIYKKLIDELPSSNDDAVRVAKFHKDFVALELIGNFSSKICCVRIDRKL